MVNGERCNGNAYTRIPGTQPNLTWTCKSAPVLHGDESGIFIGTDYNWGTTFNVRDKIFENKLIIAVETKVIIHALVGTYQKISLLNDDFSANQIA